MFADWFGRIARSTAGTASAADAAIRARYRKARAEPRPPHVIDAEKHPQDYFFCIECRDGPWHVNWRPVAAWRRPLTGFARSRLCPNCTGAD